MNTHDQNRVHLASFECFANTGVPYIARVDSEVKGPHLVFSGGVHGNETAGVVGSLQLLEALKSERLRLLRGSISFILGNPEAYRQNQRCLYRNLNTLFTQVTDSRTIEGRRATEILNYLAIVRADLAAIVDFHSVSESDLRILIYNRMHKKIGDLIERLPPMFDYHFAYEKDHLMGILSEASSLFGSEGFSVECGSHSSPLGAERVLQCMRTTMDHYGVQYAGNFPHISDEAIRVNPDMKKLLSISAIRPCPGFQFQDEDIRTGTRISAGQVFAFGNDGKEYTAERDCFAFLPDTRVTGHEPDAGFLCILKED